MRELTIIILSLLLGFIIGYIANSNKEYKINLFANDKGGDMENQLDERLPKSPPFLKKNIFVINDSRGAKLDSRDASLHFENGRYLMFPETHGIGLKYDNYKVSILKTDKKYSIILGFKTKL